MAGAAAPQPAVAEVQQLLFRRFKVELPDGRTLLGDFSCLDKQGNLILSNTVERKPAATTGSGNGGGNSGGAPSERVMGMVLVPKAQQVSVQVQGALGEGSALAAAMMS